MGISTFLGGFAAAAAVWAPRGHQNPSLGAQEWHHCSPGRLVGMRDGTRIAGTHPASSIPEGKDPKRSPEKANAASQHWLPAQALAGHFYVVPKARLGPGALKLGQFRAHPGGISLELGITWAAVIACSRTT